MAYWLASKRGSQTFDYIQRFDPRFWTVDFPRPMMASVTTTAADALRVDLEFHHADSLAGLIWESVDRLDHPLLAYQTDRDYSRTTPEISLAFVRRNPARSSERADIDDRRSGCRRASPFLVCASVELCSRHA